MQRTPVPAAFTNISVLSHSLNMICSCFSLLKHSGELSFEKSANHPILFVSLSSEHEQPSLPLAENAFPPARFPVFPKLREGSVIQRYFLL